MSKSGFFNNSGTSSTVENTIQGSVDAAAASATAAASSETDAQTAQAASEAARDASQTAQTASETAKTASEAARDAAQVSQNAAATSASTATTQAALATTNGAAQVTLATAQVALATTEANDSATSAAAALTSQNAAAASATTASTQASLATSNGAAQVALATTQANNSATSAQAASASQIAAATSANAAAAALDTFDDRYLGSKSGYSGNGTGPSVDNDGDALVEGSLFFSADANEMRVYDGSNWIAASSAGTASMEEYKYTATANQTSFSGSGLSYTTNNLIVTLNGVVLENGTDYTATNGTTVVLASGAAANDELNVIAFKSFTTADMVSRTNGGAFVGNVDFGAGVDVTGNITVTGTVDGRDVAADGTKLDGIEASADVTDATNVASAGALMTSGGTLSGNLDLGDNVRARFGAGSDLQIYHASDNHSNIRETGSGNLQLWGSNTNFLNTAGSKYHATFADGGAVTLYHNGAAKLATTSTGVDVTGTVTADGLDVSGSSTFGTPSGDTRFNFDGANQYRVVFKHSGSVAGQIGGGGADDLRFSNAAGATVVTIKNGNLGIGVSSMTNKLVLPNAAYFAMQDTSGAESLAIRANSSNAMELLTGGGVKMTIDASGRVTTPSQPSFTAHKNGNQSVTAYVDNTLTGWTCPSHGNVGSHFNTSNGRFTAPVTGFYLFTGAVQTNTQSSLHIAFHMNGSAYESDSWIDHGNSTKGAELTRIMYLTANQYVTLVMLPTVNQLANANRTRFQGYLLG